MLANVKRLLLSWTTEERVFVVLSLVTGMLAGGFVVLYHEAIEFLTSLTIALPHFGNHHLELLVFPVIGSIFGGILLLRVRQARGGGVNLVRVALVAHDGYVSIRGAIGKFVASAVGIGLGLPLGPEDPAIHIGGGSGSAIGRLLSLSKSKNQQLVAVGAAAGLAAAFNTPLTAVIFILEEVVGDINAPIVGSAVLASVVAVLIRRSALGSAALFHVAPYEFTAARELALYTLLGVTGGAASAAFTRLLTWLRFRLGQIPRRGSIDLITVAGGAFTALLVFQIPGISGAGYHWVDEALNGRLVLSALVLLFVGKFLGTSVAFAAGNSGGLFAPSLFLGAMLGGVVGHIGHYQMTLPVSSVGAYALVGMGVTFAGIIRAPITSVFMIFEVTQDYQIMLPVMVANVIGYATARALQRQPLFEILSMQDGIHLPSKDDSRLTILTAGDAMQPAALTLNPVATITAALELSRRIPLRAFPVCSDDRVLGVVTVALMEKAAAEGRGSQPLVSILAPIHGYRVFPDQPLALCLRKLGEGAFLLPVVSRLAPDQLLGVITTEDALRAYGLALPDQAAVTPTARETGLKNSER